MRTIVAARLGVPDDGDALVGEGRDLATGQSVKFLVPPEQRLRVLADAHRGVAPVITLHAFDVVPWDAVLDISWEDASG